MPELPDLQVFSKNLQIELKGKKLEKITVRAGANVNVSSAQLKKKVERETVKTVYREGKELRMAFRNGTVLGLHMMLHGKLVWYDEEPPKYSLVEMEFEKDVHLALTDFQRQARLTVDPEAPAAPDALGDEVNLSFWKKALQTKAKIKNLLLDQKVIRGIGNAYADEILWEAKISPFSVSANSPPAKVSKLVKAVRKVLKNAEKKIAKAEPDIIGGEIRDFLVIHNAHKKKSPTGAAIRVSASGGRKTYYTGEQEEF